MRRFSKKSHGAVSDINITPLLDLAWVLLVIFIITTTAMVQGIELKLPEATPHETEMETNTPTISVKKGGDIYMDEERVKLSELEKFDSRSENCQGRQAAACAPRRFRRGIQHVVAVLDILQRIPVEELAIATKPIDP